MIRALVADDEALMRTGIRLILENADDIEVVAEAADGREAAAACRAQDIDVALLDIKMPGGDGIAAAEVIARLSPRTCRDADRVRRGSERDARPAGRCRRIPPQGHRPRRTDPRGTTRRPGRTGTGPRITRRLLERHVTSGRDTEAALRRTEELTPAERDVLRLLGTGLSNAEIADRLYLSAGTVKAHISRILTRTGCANRVQAAVLAHDAGLLTGR